MTIHQCKHATHRHTHTHTHTHTHAHTHSTYTHTHAHTPPHTQREGGREKSLHHPSAILYPHRGHQVMPDKSLPLHTLTPFFIFLALSLFLHPLFLFFLSFFLSFFLCL